MARKMSGRVLRDTPVAASALLIAATSLHAQDNPLHEAARSGDVAAAMALIKAGADVNARTDGGVTPLHFAADAGGSKAMVAALIEAGADVDARDQLGVTSLHVAAWWACTAVVMALIEAGADVDVRDRRGVTPLHRAARRRGAAAVAVLIEAGADVNARRYAVRGSPTPLDIADGIPIREVGGWTALHEAAWSASSATAVVLIEAGADVNARDDQGLTPLDRAGDRAIAQMLAALGGRRRRTGGGRVQRSALKRSAREAGSRPFPGGGAS